MNISPSDTMESRPTSRDASSCAWNWPPRVMKYPSGNLVWAMAWRISATTSESGRSEALADSTMRRLPSSRLIWLGPSPSSIVASFERGIRPVGVSISILFNPLIERASSGSLTTNAKRRPPSTIWAILSPSTNDCSVARTCGAGTPYRAAAA